MTHNITHIQVDNLYSLISYVDPYDKLVRWKVVRHGESAWAQHLTGFESKMINAAIAAAQKGTGNGSGKP
jgi:hypothetical protein